MQPSKRRTAPPSAGLRLPGLRQWPGAPHRALDPDGDLQHALAQNPDLAGASTEVDGRPVAAVLAPPPTPSTSLSSGIVRVRPAGVRGSHAFAVRRLSATLRRTRGPLPRGRSAPGCLPARVM